jgi:hypothetical protein
MAHACTPWPTRDFVAPRQHPGTTSADPSAAYCHERNFPEIFVTGELQEFLFASGSGPAMPAGRIAFPAREGLFE